MFFSFNRTCGYVINVFEYAGLLYIQGRNVCMVRSYKVLTKICLVSWVCG